jgi:hypothetical protein
MLATASRKVTNGNGNASWERRKIPTPSARRVVQRRARFKAQSDVQVVRVVTRRAPI